MMNGAGETNLSVLLREMRPKLNDGVYVFCVVGATLLSYSDLRPVCTFRETEGTTLIVTQSEADVHCMAYDGVWAWITLSVHSSLAAVGLLAAITARLADAGLPTNTLSAFFHDHLFVPYAERERAISLLQGLQT